MNKDDLDDLLDRALAGYSPEPRPGLAQRVIAHVHADRKPSGWWRLIFAIPILASVIFVFVNRNHAPRPAPRPAPVSQAKVEAPQVVLPSSEPVPAMKPVRQKRRRLPQATKQDQFPSPAPLTKEETALLQLAMRAPDQ